MTKCFPSKKSRHFTINDGRVFKIIAAICQISRITLTTTSGVFADIQTITWSEALASISVFNWRLLVAFGVTFVC